MKAQQSKQQGDVRHLPRLLRVLSLVTCLVSVGGGGRPGEDHVHVPAAAPQQSPGLLHAHTPQTRPGNIHKLVPLLEPPVSETVYF